ncbi:sensor histidine kinase [Pelagicoccus mobilis]|uniref:histidine kinase n=1 Tax=Pelagicoccus mobilis TaxID=415221 RepID=A0A934VQS1_9BACT|nr:HAMP domain-containing sensor histidine kinase [Pelagicoccus mobilis]MBK1876863.1 HAMP domain-containing histidine kinase [Pelagicoccus mobilis]
MKQNSISFEASIVLKAALCALPSFLMTIGLLVYFGAEWEMWVTCLTLILAPFPFMAWSLTTWISAPLRVASNVISSIREGDFTLRSRRTTEANGTIVELYEEINAIAAILDKGRISAIETQKIIDKITVNIDVATLIVNEDRVVTKANDTAKELIASINQSDSTPEQKTVDELDISFVLDQSTQDFSRFSYVHEGRRFEGRRGLFMLEGERFDLILLTDITRAANEQERESWKRLLRVLGHELNNSIAPISSLSSTLSKITRNTDLDDETKTDILDGLDSITSRSKNIVSFMSDYTRLAKLPEPQVEAIPLAPLVQSTCQLFSDVTSISKDLPNPTVSIDQSQFEQALVNLLKNAKEAGSGSPGSVICSIHVEPNRATISIEDDGPGIANPDNLFVPFYSTKSKGSGIGLVLSKQIIEAVGGTITLKNRENAQGCCATIQLNLD